MKKSTEQMGKTVEEAIRKGLEELKVARDEVKIEILEEASKGVLGILTTKVAKVRLTVDRSNVSEEAIETSKEKAVEILNKIFEITKDDSKYDVNTSNGKVSILVNSKDSAHLIGYKGKTIDSIQSIINNIIQKEEKDTTKVFIDVNGYKLKKEEILKNLAKKMAENVVKFNKTIKLEPMSAYERMIIHSELADRKDVETESIGEEPLRRVIIKLKK